MILVTGSNGFVGRALCHTLRELGIAVRGAVRKGAAGQQVDVGDLDASTDWRAALAGCSSVVHLAARVHVMDDTAGDRLAAYRRVNVDATLNLARQAVTAGVRRFVFVSSIKVNGEATGATPFRAHDRPAPCDPYGISKLEAEQALTALSHETGLELVIVRPPLVYGPGVGANFLRLMQHARRGIPLPLGAVKNARSMVALANLVDLIRVCTFHEDAPGQVFLASDDEDLSTAQLFRKLASAMDRPARLLSIPPGLVLGLARAFGKGDVANRLFGSLQLDITHTKMVLGWKPLLSVDDAIDDTVAHFLKKRT